MNRSAPIAAIGALLFAAGALAADDAAPLVEPPISNLDREHWAFKPLVRPDAPAIGDTDWPAGEIDRFILAELERNDLAPLPVADKLVLLRRVTFDLTGLPPMPAEADAFLADQSPDAFERVVDRLLDSPAYGERWGQHWLDVARFAETDGFEHDKLRPQAWKYRDWVIDALNRDMPLDRFIQWQIAGDELAPDDSQAAVATGFLLAGPDMPDINLAEERRHMVLNEITSTVGSVFLGLQVGCAQCHDHKYDPISQADFYRLRAVFEPAELFKTPDEGRIVRERGERPVSHLMVRGDFRRPGPVVEPAFPRIANMSGKAFDSQPPSDQSSGRRAALARWLTEPDHPLVTRVLANWIWQHHFGDGLSRTPGDFGVMGDEPSHAELLDWLATEIVRQGWSLKAMHRLIVLSATYRTASKPSSPEWNAGQVSVARERYERAVAADPENRLLARASRRRLDGEAIRDAMLAAADRLSEARGGPGVMPPLPSELLNTLLKGQWKESPDEKDHRRRSVYLLVRRNLRYPLFEVFDRPDMNASCPRRNVSTTAPQALALLNSELSLAAARDLAGFLYAEEPSDDGARAVLLYRRALGRPATDAERDAAREFVRQQGARFGQRAVDAAVLPRGELPPTARPSEAAGWVSLALVVMNLNEFIYLD